MTDYVIKTSDLDAEFKISKNTRVTRLAMVGLHPDRLHKEGKSYWLTQNQYELFVDFDKYIQETGSTKDYPHLYVNAAEPLPQQDERVDDRGELATVAAVNISHDACGSDAETFDETFTQTFPTGGSSTRDRQAQIRENAQSRAAAILLAESILADRYLQNPELLAPEFRAQIDAIPLPKIDPKEYAASLLRGIEELYGAA
jgi:Tfp pilus assembly protein PilW